MGFVMKKLCLLLITPLLFSLTGCPDITKPPVKSGENTANEQSVAKAEIVSGKVLDSQGKPISIKDSQITVRAPFFYNQFELVKQIALSLPIGTILYTKTHPDDLGGIPISKLKYIAGC